MTMVDPILERIANKDGSLSVEQLIQEVINVRAERDALAAKVDEAQAAAVTLSVKLGTAEDRVRELEAALRGLYDDNVDYLRLNNLGGYDNHWLVAARKALGITAETTVNCNCPNGSYSKKHRDDCPLKETIK
jgi:hypothetical protein